MTGRCPWWLPHAWWPWMAPNAYELVRDGWTILVARRCKRCALVELSAVRKIRS